MSPLHQLSTFVEPRNVSGLRPIVLRFYLEHQWERLCRKVAVGRGGVGSGERDGQLGRGAGSGRNESQHSVERKELSKGQSVHLLFHDH